MHLPFFDRSSAAALLVSRSALSCIALLVFAPSVNAASLLESERFVLTSHFVDSYQISADDDAIGFDSRTPGLFLEAAVGGAGVGDLVNARGEATQDSNIILSSNGTLQLEGSGGAGGLFDVAEPGYPSRAQSHSDSHLSVVFSVDEASEYVLSTALFAELAQLDRFSGSGPLESEIFATARLYGLASGVLFDREARDSLADDRTATDSYTQSGVLAPDTYVLEIVASAFLRGFEDAAGLGSASFGVGFAVVPEPGTAILIGFGLAFLSRSRGRSNRMT